MNRLLFFVALMSLSALPNLIFGQVKSVDANYHEVPFVEVVKDLESSYDLRFFYDPGIDSVKVSLEIVSATIEQALLEISKVSGLNFYMPDNGIVIVTNQYQISDTLPPEVFEQSVQNSQAGSSDDTILENISEYDAEDLGERAVKVIVIGDASKRFQGNEATISGYVYDYDTGEPIIGAALFQKDPVIGTATDAFGFYSLTLPKGERDLHISSIGMKQLIQPIKLFSDGTLNVNLHAQLVSLREVVVTGETNPVDNLQTGFANINVKNINQLPSVMGEADIMKIALSLPGVQTVGEGAAGFNVRGGSADQNLVLLNDIPVYNTNHLFGFISVFNPDVLAGADLYKSGIGANYGGRLSSVFDVKIKDGNRKKFQLKGGISPITAKLSVEGPIKQDTSSYIVGFRTTYSDWVFSIFNDPALKNSTANFYDVVGKVTHKVNANNSLIATGYYSLDNFRLNSDSLYAYSSSNAALHWRNKINNQMQLTTSLSYANYTYDLSSESNPTNDFKLSYHINHYAVKSELNYFTKKNFNLKTGLSSIFYDLQPGRLEKVSETSLTNPISTEMERGVESALYAGAEINISEKFSTYAGIRFSMFNRLGPGKQYLYQPNTPKEPEFIRDTLNFSSGELMKTYWAPELRALLRYKLRSNLSLKLAYDRNNQYIHILSNTTSISPIDTWRLSSPDIKPQIGHQISLGLYQTVYNTSLELSVEGYYKRMGNVLDYKDGAQLLLNEALETDVVGAEGKAYGIEVLLKKNSGKLTGWLSYTFARAFLRADSEYNSERINFGEYYAANYDKPHTAILVSNYKLNRRFNLSLNVNYSTGRPVTVPLGKYELKNQPLLVYTQRNQFRIPDYFRVDLALNLEGNHKVTKKIHSSWSFSIYNLLGRNNAYSVYFKSEGGQINGYQLSVFKDPIPTITYHFRML